MDSDRTGIQKALSLRQRSPTVNDASRSYGMPFLLPYKQVPFSFRPVLTSGQGGAAGAPLARGSARKTDISAQTSRRVSAHAKASVGA